MLPYLDNALRAQVVYQRDKDYVDERPGDHRRVHRPPDAWPLLLGRAAQAIEAKEGVEVRKENLTLATITFQNYFRMYESCAA